MFLQLSGVATVVFSIKSFLSFDRIILIIFSSIIGALPDPFPFRRFLEIGVHGMKLFVIKYSINFSPRLFLFANAKVCDVLKCINFFSYLGIKVTHDHTFTADFGFFSVPDEHVEAYT